MGDEPEARFLADLALTALERSVLILRMGVDRGTPRTAAEVGVELNLSEFEVRQIERDVLRRLRP